MTTVVGLRKICGQLELYSKRSADRDFASLHTALHAAREPLEQLNKALKQSGVSSRIRGKFLENISAFQLPGTGAQAIQKSGGVGICSSDP